MGANLQGEGRQRSQWSSKNALRHQLPLLSTLLASLLGSSQYRDLPCSWAGRERTGTALPAGSPLGIRALLLLELPSYSQHIHDILTQTGKANCCFLACPSPRDATLSRCKNPSKGRPKLWGL